MNFSLRLVTLSIHSRRPQLHLITVQKFIFNWASEDVTVVMVILQIQFADSCRETLFTGSIHIQTGQSAGSATEQFPQRW